MEKCRLHELQNAWFVDRELFPTHGKSTSKVTLYALAYFAFLGVDRGLAAVVHFIVPWRNTRSIIKNVKLKRKKI